MNEAEITQYAKEFLKKAYNWDLDIPVIINSRLSRALGRYVHSRLGQPLRIELSKKFLINGNLSDIHSTIKHECIHYVLHQMGKPYRDGMPLFESELAKHGSNSTGTVKLTMERNFNIYKCGCNEHKFKRALSNGGRYHSCKKCKESLVYQGKRKMVV